MNADLFLKEFNRIKSVGAIDLTQSPLQLAIHDKLTEREAVMYIRFLLNLGFDDARLIPTESSIPVVEFTKSSQTMNERMVIEQ
jgi:hypothetical protein